MGATSAAEAMLPGDRSIYRDHDARRFVRDPKLRPLVARPRIAQATLAVLDAFTPGLAGQAFVRYRYFDEIVPRSVYLEKVDALRSYVPEYASSLAALALKFGEAVRLQDISILGLVGHCETAEEARSQANRFGRLAVDDGNDKPSHRIEFVRDGSNVWLNFAGTLYREHPLFTESVLARAVCDGRAFAVVHPDRAWPEPKALSFTYEEPSYRAEYDRIFRLPISFNVNMNAIMFGEELLSVRVAPPNQYVSRLVRQQAEGLLEQLERSSSTRAQVEQHLMHVLHTGEASIEVIAKKLGLSRQTLFRKLKEEGMTFEKVLDELRHKLALQYLQTEKITVNETAYRVGFSDPAAFSRAFKRLTGLSPRAMINGTRES